MTDMTLDEFYKANIDKEKEYVRVYAAREVTLGEEIKIGSSRLVAHEDGYIVGHYVGFMTKDEFAAKTTSAEGLELPVPKKDLSEEMLLEIKPVKKGEEVTIDMGCGQLAREHIYHDGFVITKANGQFYLPNFDLTSEFNYAGKKYETEKELIVTLNSEQPFKGILLEEKTGLSVPDNSILYPDSKEEGGYMVESLLYPPNTRLRLSAGWTDRQTFHETAREKQAKLNARAPRVQLR